VIAKAQDFSKLFTFGFIVLPPLGIIKAALIMSTWLAGYLIGLRISRSACKLIQTPGLLKKKKTALIIS